MDTNTLKRIDNYPEYLESAWQEHLQSKPENAPTVISTFAGCGGSSLGYSMAGFREPLAVEWDDNAVETFKLNFPGVPVYHGDIAKLSVDECLRIANIAPGNLDVLDGSPPCQGFSTAGKRDFSDDRNQLFREYVRLLRGLRPKVFVMENVSGMVKGVMKIIFVEILRELKASGYQVSARLLNAMYFGVPQSRQRMIFVGVRDDLGIAPSHPNAETEPVTFRNAVVGLPQTQQIKESMHVWQNIKETSKTYRALLQTQEGETLVGFSIAKRLSFDKVAGTLQTGGEVPGCPGSSWFAHPVEHRGISIREGARIASFPDSFNFGNDYRESARRLGNSVAPLMMCSIARHIRAEILSRVASAQAG